MTTNESWKLIADGGFRYLGAVSASVSHDIRNKLAVINEKAGLLEDMATMMLEGRTIDLERLRTQAQKMKQQVLLTNRIISDLNTFAHTVDAPLKSIDVVELVALLTDLSTRKASMANATIDTSGQSGRVCVTTMPFFLGTLIGHCLDTALARVDDTNTITIITERSENGASIHFGHVRVPECNTQPADPGAAVAALLGLLDGRIVLQSDQSEILLEVSDLGQLKDGGQP